MNRFQIGDEERDDHFAEGAEDWMSPAATSDPCCYRWDCFLARAQNQPPGFLAPFLIGRPQLKLRKHDVEVGWFKCVAERNGAASLERIQFATTMQITTGDGRTTGPMPIGTLAKARAKLIK